MNTREPKCYGSSRFQSGGFALLSAIFLITILFLLSAYLVSFRVQQDASSALDTLSTRAFAAAHAGAEWGAYNSLRNGACAGASLTLGGTLAPFTVTITCIRSSFNEGGVAINIDAIVATACNQPAAGVCPNGSPGARYAERQIAVTVGQ